MSPGYPAADFTKSNVKNRLTRKAAELWGYDETDLEGFDPLVNLLFEACAVEFEKMGQELANTQHRLVERIAALLNPDVVDAPLPAHAIAQAQAREPVMELPANAQFTFQRPVVGRQAPPPPVFFSPLQPARLVGGAVKRLATDSTMWQVENGVQKRVLAQAPEARPAAHRRLWIGLDLPEGAKLGDLAFYFDWVNELRRDEYAAFLPGEAWLLGNQPVRVAHGLPRPGSEQAVPLLQQEYDFLHRVERHVRELYSPNFVRLVPDADTAPDLATYARSPYPLELVNEFEAGDLQILVQPLVWLEVRFSHALPVAAFDSLVCAINCFPVLNRRLHRVLYRLQPALNIFPLTSEEPFLAIKEIYSLSNVAYRSTTLSELTEGATDTYTLRAHGVGRFDTRSGKEALRELLELLRDESRAFTAAGTDFVSGILRELNQNMARLEERLDRTREAENATPYVMLRPQDPTDSVYLEYWSSNGEAGNRLPAGSRLQVYDGQYVDEVRLLTTTAGGRERPRPEERTYALRRNLLTRGRLVTLEDIRAACWAELGAQLAQVHIEKGFQTSPTPEAGFVRCIRVTLTPAEPSRLSHPEWQRAAHALQVRLTKQSAMNLPYEVVVTPLRTLA